MSGGFENFATDFVSNAHGCRSNGQIFLRLVVLYALLAVFWWTESLFRDYGVEIEAKVELIGAGPKNTTLVRYYFRDPETGKQRMNTVQVGAQQIPKNGAAIVEYIPGAYPTSRLKSQSKPWSIHVFFWVNVVLAISLLGLTIYLIREANLPVRHRRF